MEHAGGCTGIYEAFNPFAWWGVLINQLNVQKWSPVEGFIREGGMGFFEWPDLTIEFQFAKTSSVQSFGVFTRTGSDTPFSFAFDTASS